MKNLIFGILLGLASTSFSQEIIIFNPSFEDEPRPGKVPMEWINCGHEGETPPDINPNGSFKVGKTAQDGDTYLGMVTRDNDTWESVGQELTSPLLEGHPYDFFIFLARSQYYTSLSRKTNKEANYTAPIRLRVWGGNAPCEKGEMLAESSLVTNNQWKQFLFEFTPTSDWSYIILEAFYDTPTLFPYNGNVLLDNMSSIMDLSEPEDLGSEIEYELDDGQSIASEINKVDAEVELLEASEIANGAEEATEETDKALNEYPSTIESKNLPGFNYEGIKYYDLQDKLSNCAIQDHSIKTSREMDIAKSLSIINIAVLSDDMRFIFDRLDAQSIEQSIINLENFGLSASANQLARIAAKSVVFQKEVVLNIEEKTFFADEFEQLKSLWQKEAITKKLNKYLETHQTDLKKELEICK